MSLRPKGGVADDGSRLKKVLTAGKNDNSVVYREGRFLPDSEDAAALIVSQLAHTGEAGSACDAIYSWCKVSECTDDFLGKVAYNLGIRGVDPKNYEKKWADVMQKWCMAHKIVENDYPYSINAEGWASLLSRRQVTFYKPDSNLEPSVFYEKTIIEPVPWSDYGEIGFEQNAFYENEMLTCCCTKSLGGRPTNWWTFYEPTTKDVIKSRNDLRDLNWSDRFEIPGYYDGDLPAAFRGIPSWFWVEGGFSFHEGLGKYAITPRSKIPQVSWMWYKKSRELKVEIDTADFYVVSNTSPPEAPPPPPDNTNQLWKMMIRGLYKPPDPPIRPPFLPEKYNTF